MQQSVPKGLRPHIVLVGRVNSGKSTLFNRILGENLALVSPTPGTTTDTVSKAFELPGFGAVILTDTPGLEDDTPLGELRMEATRKALLEADLVLLVAKSESPSIEELVRSLTKAPLLTVSTESMTGDLDSRTLGESDSLAPLFDAISAQLEKSESKAPESITGRLAKERDLVLLVMPQDSEAPKGRLILPQVQVIRELLDKHCIVLSVQPEELPSALCRLKESPQLIITDSQRFADVERLTPADVPLTSFSVLMSAYKGDLTELIKGAEALDTLTEESRVLIAEACSHAPNGEDIGTVKIPRLLRKRFGEGLRIDFVSGKAFPRDLTPYDLVIHCGACMFNRAHLLARQRLAAEESVPMTNYGIAIAKLLGILSRTALPY